MHDYDENNNLFALIVNELGEVLSDISKDTTVKRKPLQEIKWEKTSSVIFCSV